ACSRARYSIREEGRPKRWGCKSGRWRLQIYTVKHAHIDTPAAPFLGIGAILTHLPSRFSSPPSVGTSISLPYEHPMSVLYVYFTTIKKKTTTTTTTTIAVLNMER
ncbi:unnamed protein product, partial [Ectocarpus sp. 12 AP-2014]